MVTVIKRLIPLLAGVVLLSHVASAQVPALERNLGWSDAQYNNLISTVTQIAPQDATNLPPVGMFYSVQNPSQMPTPGNFYGLPAWDLGHRNYLLDDVGFQPQARSGRAKGEAPLPPGGETNYGSGSTNGFVYTFDTNGLWLDLTNISNGIAYGNLHNATNQVYALWSTTDAMGGWQVETEIWPSNTSLTPFAVDVSGRSNLFMVAQDWTGVTHGGNTIPDWWFWEYFGITALSDTNLDAGGMNQLSEDYQYQMDPNIVNFWIRATNQTYSQTYATLPLDVYSGTPYYQAVLFDDTNLSDANWQPYSSSNLAVNLGPAEGWHSVWVGLRGRPASSHQTWQYIRLKLDATPPALTITSPLITNSIAGPVSVPLLQLQGYSDEALSSISYDLSNSSGCQTNLQAVITGQFYSTNTFEFTTNSFAAIDMPLVPGANSITLRATDWAGNASSTNFSVTVDYSSRTNPPAVQLYWPQNGATICGSTYSWRGWVNDPTASILAQIVDASGDTNTIDALVERNGNFWVENISLDAGTNYLTLTVLDSAGNQAVTNIVLYSGTAGLTINAPTGTSLWNASNTVTGTIADGADYSVWVNGVQAAISGNSWTAANVQSTPNGTAVFEARAIPSTDHGGAGTGGSEGTTAPAFSSMENPTSAQAQDAEVETDRPERYYIAQYNDTESGTEKATDNWTDAAGNPSGSIYGYSWDSLIDSGQISGSWSDGAGGQSTWNWTGIGDNSISGGPWTNTAWVDATYDGAGNPTITSEQPDDESDPFSIQMEHCDIGTPLEDNSGDYVDPPDGYGDQYDASTEADTENRNADAQVLFDPGGKQVTGAKNLYILSGSATENRCSKWPIPLWANPWPQIAWPVDPTSIAVGALGNLDTNGTLGFSLSSGSGPVDATFYVEGMQYFVYGLLVSSPYSIEHHTQATAAGNHDDTRTTIGVGEVVELSGMPSATKWSTSAGSLSDSSGSAVTFTAPDHGGAAVVTAKFGHGGLATVNFSVKEPTSESAVIKSTNTYPAGQQGVGMLLSPITVAPTAVSFYNVQCLEVPGPATDITGYFTNSTNLAHHPNTNWEPLSQANTWEDTAALTGCQPPWYPGGFKWIIPVRWNVKGSTNIGTLPNRIQTFSILDTNGTSQVSKLGQSTTRTP